jgi:hypothetical protein
MSTSVHRKPGGTGRVIRRHGLGTNVIRAAPSASGPTYFGEGGWAHVNGSANLVLSVPAGIKKGTLMLAIVICETGINASTPPAGWVQVLTQSNTTIRVDLYGRYAGTSEPATYTFTVSAVQANAGDIVAWSNAFIDALLNLPFNRLTTANTVHVLQSFGAAMTPGHDGVGVEFWVGNGGALAGTETWSITTNPNSGTIRTQSTVANQSSQAVADFPTTAYTAVANGDTATSTFGPSNFNNLIGFGLVLV